MTMAMAGQGGHRWTEFRTRLSLSFNFSHIICTHENVRKGEGEPGNEASAITCFAIIVTLYLVFKFFALAWHCILDILQYA